MLRMFKKYRKEILIGLVTGMLNGLFGAGGGSVVVPAMEKFLGVDEKKSHATAIAIILMMSLVSSFLYIRKGFFDLKIWFIVSVGGLAGAFIPVTEDAGMIAAARSGDLQLEKLEAMTAVCSVGLDMIAIPGETPAEVISAIIADEAAIGMVNSKTTAVRVIPAIGKKAGEELNFGGLLGSGPIMRVNLEKSPKKFIDRAGRIPAPLQSLKN
mgnify:CR=1 FL=1